jgi:chemotaxis signal transduction protein
MNPQNPNKSDDQTLPNEPNPAVELESDPQLHDLVPFDVGDRVFAVFADQVDGTAEGKVPAPLPRAPVGVLGVVCVRGRMLTVLDPIAVLTGAGLTWPQSLPCVIGLRGDEQLALAAHRYRDTITIINTDIQQLGEAVDDPLEPTLGLVRYGGEEITVINIEGFFATAMQRRERRRRRF